jgi:hypothetical protein
VSARGEGGGPPREGARERDRESARAKERWRESEGARARERDFKIGLDLHRLNVGHDFFVMNLVRLEHLAPPGGGRGGGGGGGGGGGVFSAH